MEIPENRGAPPAPPSEPPPVSNELDEDFEQVWASRTMTLGAAYAALAGTVAVTTTYADRHPLALVGFLAVPTVVAPIVLVSSRGVLAVEGPSRDSLLLFRVAVIFGAAAWAMGALGALTDRLDADAIVVVVATVFLASISRWGLAFDPTLRALAPVVVTVPPAVACFASGMVQGVGAALLCIALLVALVRNGTLTSARASDERTSPAAGRSESDRPSELSAFRDVRESGVYGSVRAAGEGAPSGEGGPSVASPSRTASPPAKRRA